MRQSTMCYSPSSYGSSDSFLFRVDLEATVGACTVHPRVIPEKHIKHPVGLGRHTRVCSSCRYTIGMPPKGKPKHSRAKSVQGVKAGSVPLGKATGRGRWPK